MLWCMRTTLTLDDDVAAQLERVRRRRRATRKQVVNDALRAGLSSLEAPAPAVAFQTRTVSLGRFLLNDLDNVAEILDIAEGERLG